MLNRVTQVGLWDGIPADATPGDAVRGRAPIPFGLVLSASLFNMVLCFANTEGLHVSLGEVAATELLIIALAAASVWRTLLSTALAPSLLVLGWFVVVRLINPVASPKIVLDLAMPVTFYAVGRAYATQQIGNRLVLMLACLVFAVGLFEWFAFDSYQRLFNVFDYYLGKGDLKASQAGDTGTTLGENGVRPGARELLPFLGGHRIGSVFLEPIAVGNFATVVLAWVVARARLDRFAVFLVAVALALAVFADDRFAVGAGLAIVVAVRSGAWRWRWVAAVIPFATLALLLVFAATSPERVVDNTIGGRLYGSGSYLLEQGPVEWLALTPAVIDMDSGFSYLVDSIGVIVPAALWLLFACRRNMTPIDARLTLGIGVYLSLSLCISGSSTSIKTAALLWVLAGSLRSSAAGGEPVV